MPDDRTNAHRGDPVPCYCAHCGAVICPHAQEMMRREAPSPAVREVVADLRKVHDRFGHMDGLFCRFAAGPEGSAATFAGVFWLLLVGALDKLAKEIDAPREYPEGREA